MLQVRIQFHMLLSRRPTPSRVSMQEFLTCTIATARSTCAGESGLPTRAALPPAPIDASAARPEPVIASKLATIPPPVPAPPVLFGAAPGPWPAALSGCAAPVSIARRRNAWQKSEGPKDERTPKWRRRVAKHAKSGGTA